MELKRKQEEGLGGSGGIQYSIRVRSELGTYRAVLLAVWLFKHTIVKL